MGKDGNKIAAIGIGQGGSNLAIQLASVFGTQKNIGLVNLSSQDNESAKGVPLENIVNLDGTGFSGAGKDRTVGKSAYSDNYDKIGDLAAKVAKGCDYLFVCYSLAGGTGSGLGPAVTGYLSTDEFKKKLGTTIITMGLPILPDYTEGTIAMTNAVEALEEIHKLSIKGIASFAIIDNGFSKATKINEKYAEINNHAAELLKRYLLVFGNSRSGCLDTRDRARGMGVPGLHSFVAIDANGFPGGPFKIPEGSRVKLALCELPEDKSEMFPETLVSLGVIKDDSIMGFYEGDLMAPIVHLAGYNTATKISEELRGHLQRIKNLGVRQESEDLSGKGFKDLKSEKEFLKDQYGKKGAADSQSILDILG